MKIVIRIFILLCCSNSMSAQKGFTFVSNKSKVTIPFKFINNLVIVPIKVNGVELNFLLDSGVDETILFSLDQKEEVKFYNIEKLKLKGLGSQDAVEGLRSSKNTLSVGGLISHNQEVWIVLDETMNFSSSLGIPVNGIIGYRFFENNLVQINYAKHRLIVYNKDKIDKEKIIKNFTPFDISIEKNKPYIQSIVTIDDKPIPAKLLLDTGNSDAIWLFDKKSENIVIPSKNFNDFLGRGFSGEIFGKKAKINNFSLKDFQFKNPIVSFPDSISIRNVKMVDNRMGSIGGEVFKRFQVIFDYANNKLYIKKNSNYNMPFHYNKSGIEFHHAGVRLVQEAQREDYKTIGSVKIGVGDKAFEVKYKFELKPVFEIASIRKGSPAEQVGLKKGDILISINRSPSHYYTLQQINEMLKSEEEKVIEVEIERESKPLTFKVKLENLL